jgi:hypothetical protein
VKQTRRSLFGSLLAVCAFPFIGRAAKAEPDYVRIVKANAAPLKPHSIMVVSSQWGSPRLNDLIVIGSCQAKRQFVNAFVSSLSWDTEDFDEIVGRASVCCRTEKPLRFDADNREIIRAVKHAMRNCGMQVSLLRTDPYSFVADYNAKRDSR